MKMSALILAAAALTPATAAFAADGIEAAVVVPPVTAQAAAPVVGKMLYSTGGKKLAPVYKLDPTGAPQILLDGKMLTVPVKTLSTVDGHVETSLTKKDLMTGN